MKIINTKGILHPDGSVELTSMKKISWKDLGDEIISSLPPGTEIDFTISFDENTFLSGKNGIVWATFDLRQAEIILNSLRAQRIESLIINSTFNCKKVYLIQISKKEEIDEAIDFIWKSETGLRLKADWTYPVGEANKSFKKWLNER